MISTLTELVAPMPVSDFQRLLAQRQLGRVPGHQGRFDHLLTWDVLRGILEQGAIRPAQLRVTRGGDDLARAFYVRDGQVMPEPVLRVLDQGGSIVLNLPSGQVPRLDTLAASLSSDLCERVSVAVIVTAGAGGALKHHFDVPDVIVLQVEGAKRWLIYDRPEPNPVRGGASGPAPESVVHDAVLTAGDLLFVPAGHWHRCENTSERSLHVALMLVPPTAAGLLFTVAERIRDDDRFRRPLTRISAAEQTAAAEALREAVSVALAGLPGDIPRLWRSANNVDAGY